MLYNLLVFFTTLAPVWAVLLDRLPLKGKRWFIFTELSILSASVFFLIMFQHWRWFSFANVIWFMYSIELGIFLFLSTKRFGYHNFNRNLAISMLFVYVLSEAHEWVGFVFADYLHFFQDPFTIATGKVPTWQRILNNLYVLIAFNLAWKWSGFKRNWKTSLGFAATMLIPVFFLVSHAGTELHIFKRFLLFCSWAAIFYFQANPTISSGTGGNKVEASMKNMNSMNEP